MIKVVKSRGFNLSMSSTRRVKQVQSNLKQVGDMASKHANTIAPIQDGDLRDSMQVRYDDLTVVITWRRDYARYRYYINLKNPQTTNWAERSYRIIGGKLGKIMGGF